METRTATHVDTELGRLRGISWLFLVASVVFFATIFNPVSFGYFDAATEAERLSHVEDNLLALRLVFMGMGVTEAALGVGLWLWGRHVADRTPGRRGGVARASAVVGLISGAVMTVGRLSAWFEDAQQLASDDPSLLEILLGIPAWIGFSLSIIVFGYLMVRGAMPTWLGVTWIVCGVLFWVGLIPFWFFFAAFIFGIRGIRKFRPGKATVEQVSATRPA
jgi:hypothetical protein